MRKNVILPNNYVLARRRLKLLKKRLLRNKNLFARYSAVMHDHIAKGYISQDNEGDIEGRWYLPHHSVLNAHKLDEVRIVFDCTAQFKGNSLNSELLSGSNLTKNVTGVLLRFRKYPVALCSDIEEMCLQVGVPQRTEIPSAFFVGKR